VLSHDTGLVSGGIERFGISVVTRESLVTVRDVKTSITGSLHGTENFGTSGGVLDSNIQQGTERSLLVIDLTNEVSAAVHDGGNNLTSWLLNTGIGLIKTNLFQQTTSQQQTSAVSGSVVLQASGQTMLDQLLRSGRCKDFVTVDLSVNNLADDVSVGKSHNKTIFRGLVFVLVLGDKFVTLTVISATLYKVKLRKVSIYISELFAFTSSSSELDLEGLEVSLVFENFDERLTKDI
jgi:hypothetical protein